MTSKNALCGLAMAVALQLGMLAGSAQTNIYLFSGSERNITLPPGTYIITAYGAPGASPNLIFAPLGGWGGSGAEMSAEFNFSTSTNLTLLVGGGGYPYHPYDYGYAGGGGGGGSFVVNGTTPLVIAGGGGGPGESNDPGGNGNVSNNGGVDSSIGYGAGGGGTDGGGGVGGFGVGKGGGGGGFLGNGTNRVVRNGDGGGGSSFENGGNGGNGGIGIPYSGGNGGYGGGGGGGSVVGNGGGGGGYSGGGGGGLSGGGGGSIIDSSAIAILAEVSGITSPDDATNGEIIIIAIPTPLAITTNAAFGFTNGVFGFNLLGPAGSNVVIQASTDLQTWIPLQTYLLGSGALHFSDAQSPANPRRFYRAQLSPAYTVGGTLTGLPAGDTVTLQDNGSDNLTLSTNGTFTFPTALPNGHAYSVTVSGTSGGTPTICTLTNGSGTISGANVTYVAVQCTSTPTCPALTGNMDLDMYNAAVSDGTANGGVPAVMLTENGGPFRVTAEGRCSNHVCEYYYGRCVFTRIVGTDSCSSTTLPSGGWVIQFGTALICGFGPYEY